MYVIQHFDQKTASGPATGMLTDGPVLAGRVTARAGSSRPEGETHALYYA